MHEQGYSTILHLYCIVFYSFPFYSILFYSIPFYLIPSVFILFFSFLFFLFYSILFYSILFYSILFYSILFNAMLKKKFYEDLHCFHSTYSSPCDLLKKITCPEIFKEHGFTCRCPIKKNEYKLPASIIAIPDIKLPSFIENVSYLSSAIKL